jgi:hypothetical protein
MELGGGQWEREARKANREAGRSHVEGNMVQTGSGSGDSDSVRDGVGNSIGNRATVSKAEHRMELRGGQGKER